MQKTKFFLQEKLNHISVTNGKGGRAMWRAVILQAFMDSVSNCKRTESKVAKSRSRSWLTSMCYDFKLVCSMAGYNPHYVKRKAVGFIQENKNISQLIKELNSTVAKMQEKETV